MDNSGRKSRRARSGFTLVELMIVISIVALLAGLLLVAVQGALGAGDTAQVTNDIKEIETALEAFKNEYGVYPPSSFVFDEDPTTGTALAVSFPAATAETISFATSTWPLLSLPAAFDFNSDGDTADKLTLNGSECLVLFLAGLPVTDASGNVGFLGLSSNPTNPFETGTSVNRKRFLEIDPSRLSDIDSDGLPELLDSTGKIQTPFNYLRATPLGSYRPQGPDGVWGTLDDETLSNGTTIVGPAIAYYQIPALGAADVDADGSVDASSSVPGAGGTAVPWKPTSFQIVWPGYDEQFGTGGTVVNEDSGRVPNETINVTTGTGASAFPANSERQTALEADNMTNFIRGALGR